MKKCTHVVNTRFFRAKKYTEEILVEYTYCEKCGEVFSGTVNFVKPVKFPEKLAVPVPAPKPKPATVIKETPKPVKAPKPKTPKKKASPPKKPTNVAPRPPTEPSEPTLGDIMAKLYGIERNPIPQVEKTSFKMVDADSLESSGNSEIFTK